MRSPFGLVAGFLLLAAFGVGDGAAAAAGESRVALVIGNGDYLRGDLPNATNDASLVAAALQRFDFDVHDALNVTTGDLDRSLDSVASVAADADILVVYYAGHAFQYGGENFLMMTDASSVDAQSTFAGSVPMSRLMARLAEMRPQALVLLLDSCRDNPFLSERHDMEKGLTHIEAGTGQVMIGYATTEGQVAYDGAGRNSPYAIAISRALDSSASVSLSALFRDVRRTVREATNGMQIPWVSSSVEEDIVLSIPEQEIAAIAPAQIASPTLAQVQAYFAGNGSAGTLSTVRDPGATMRIDLSAGAGAQSNAGDMDFAYAATADRTPARELRLWPGELPGVDRGLGTIVTDCDLYAADPDDPARVAPGARLGLVPTRPAALACIRALLDDPDNPRLEFQLARVLEGARLYEWSVYFYEKAVASGYSAAMVQLGYLYREGRGLERNYDTAFMLTRQAALAGNLRARTNLGSMFRDGQGVAQDHAEAVLWYRLAGSMGWPNALDALANMYRRGDGVEQSAEAAFDLYRIAADAGQTNAMNNLGQAYLKGEGVAKDVEEGLRWLRRGADAGNRFAARSLALQLLDSDPLEAERLLLLSADRNNPAARIDLAKLYWRRNGAGDRVEAYFQAALAAALEVRSAADLGADYAAQLSPAEVQRVDDDVREWLRLYGD